ncbi:uncharacterized protein RHO25_006677 [Cercospora beticola]|uniref:Uncharacterized protein n=1 Tax=Cercospora beticola TaxID=122368 RepID=A0ABZ0NR63_CERBT|nr:hypothetical protein RHO25_006677 [Cercospora beticola]
MACLVVKGAVNRQGTPVDSCVRAICLRQIESVDTSEDKSQEDSNSDGSGPNDDEAGIAELTATPRTSARDKSRARKATTPAEYHAAADDPRTVGTTANKRGRDLSASAFDSTADAPAKPRAKRRHPRKPAGDVTM